MHMLSGLYLLEMCLLACYLLVLVFSFVFCPVLPDDIAIIEVFLWAKFLKIMNFACISVWFGDEALHSKCERF